MGQGKLYRIYDELLQERGVPSRRCCSRSSTCPRGPTISTRATLQTLLRWRVLPVINENDTTLTDEISFGDNDFLAAQVAILLGADRLVLLGHRRPLQLGPAPGSRRARAWWRR